MKKIKWSILLSFVVLAFSCDLLRNSPYVVEAWTPGEGFHNDPGRLKVSLLLSHESDRSKTEQAFSLTEDHKTLKGDFSWEGKRFVFLPAAPLEPDRDYFVSLGTGAQDLKGISLENKFEASFSTRVTGGKPRIIGTSPGYEESLSGDREEFILFFSAPVRLNSCIDYVSFNPVTPGSWRLEDDNKAACFTPREPWQAGTHYRVRVGSDFTAVSGSILGTDYTSAFLAGPDRGKPVLLKALALGNGENAVPEEIVLEEPHSIVTAGFSGWESFTRLILVFSEPVDSNGVRNLLVTEPSAALVMESPPGMLEQLVFRFAEYPAWGSAFLFRLGSGVKDQAGNESKDEYLFRITASGPLSKAPALRGIRLPMAPGNVSGDYEALSYSPADLFADLPIEHGEGRYPYAQSTDSWIELYFETGPDTEPDPFSVMDLFRVESTNQALTFSPRSIRTDGFTLASAAPGWENFRRLEIRGVLTNTVHSGIVTFRIPPGLRDRRGNKSSADFRISLLK